MSKMEMRREALNRQGGYVGKDRRFFIPGGPARAEFEEGGEGLVHLAVEQRTQIKYRIKCFWESTPVRRRRSEILAREQLADRHKTVADALAGAPFELLEGVSRTTPFAVVMKNVQGLSWKNLREQAEADPAYPPKNWPPVEVRATWAYGLATAVKNMEARNFIHADLSPGNVMVTAHGNSAGDMALVDFDGFVHPSYPHLDSTIKGCNGYAASEIWAAQSARTGSDRIGMAILLQEFLVVGDPDISREQAYRWAYHQDNEIGNRTADAHPLLARKYPGLGNLVVETIRAPNPESRPGPEAWRQILRSIAEGRSHGPRLRSITVQPHPLDLGAMRLAFGDQQDKLDLLATPFGIRATLERNADATVDVVVHPGAEVRIQLRGSTRWHLHRGGDRTPAAPDLILFDGNGKLAARLGAEEY